MLAFRILVAVVATTLCAPAIARGEAITYRQPPKAIADVYHAPALPTIFANPTHDTLAIVEPLRYPPIADLARPMLRIAGLRIDPRSNGIHHALAYTSLVLERVADGTTTTVALPADARITAMRFSPDGKHFAMANATTHGIDLYLGTTATGTIAHVGGVDLNGLFGDPISWMPDGTHVLVRVLDRRGAAPVAPAVPSGPIVQETTGNAGQIVTYEDLLANPHDEDLFDFYGTSRLALVDLATLTAKPFGPPAIYASAVSSPSGTFVLVERIHRPYSYLFPYERFPTTIEALAIDGAPAGTIVDRGLQDALPVDGVVTGPRDVTWKPNEPATLSYVEALDGGDPRTLAEHRDRVFVRPLLARIAPLEIARMASRVQDVSWLARDDRAIVREYDRPTRLTRHWLVDARGAAPKAIGMPLRDGDAYNDPGRPLLETMPNDTLGVMHDRDAIFLAGNGYGPDGRRPFVDRYDLATATATRIFRSALAPLDSPIGFIDAARTMMLVSRQSPAMPPNVYVRAAAGDRALTHVSDPAPALRTVERRVVRYKRADGVDLSFTLYLPPGYKEGTRLATFVWAYPAEFNDAAVASQNTNSAQTFQTIGGASEIYLALAGYAVLDNASIPIVGDSLTANDTYVEQLVAGAKAAIDKAVELGVTDPERVAVGGHSYGAFMAANLLAHSKLFRAGIARSGAYNRTLTPFGFQNERRTYWQATELYTNMSPFTFADKITDPLLLIHGMVDDNTGTFPIQSERLFAAIKGNGGTARLVMLPNESHGYLSRESNATVLAEMVDWLDRFVKNAAPRKM
jgi:dipeptidyl aminopeptidase/acylaminoacyl peptidase